MFLKFYFPKNFVYLTMLIVKQYLFFYKEVPLLQVLSHTACLRAFACIPRLFPDGTWVLTASLGWQTEQSFSCIYFDMIGCDISVAEYHTCPFCLLYKYMNTTDEHTHKQHRHILMCSTSHHWHYILPHRHHCHRYSFWFSDCLSVPPKTFLLFAPIF